MNIKVLVLGYTGKMGIALVNAFSGKYEVIGKNSSDFDASKVEQVKNVLEVTRPDIVINTVAFLGIDPCEKDPEKAFRINTLFPKQLAELSNANKFTLMHFSTDAVFNNQKGSYYTESDCPQPLNMYGMTKYGGDLFVQSIAEKYYIFRISVLFGETIRETQFVEKMIKKAKEGSKVLKVASDIILSPSYSKDIALEIKRIYETKSEFGLYHLVNSGSASLYDLMKEICNNLALDVTVEKASYKEFDSIGVKNTNTPLKSENIKPLRSWVEAVADYCNNI